MIRRFTSLHAQVSLHDVPDTWGRPVEHFWSRQALVPATYPIEIRNGPADGWGEPIRLTWAGGTLVGQRATGRISLPGRVAFEVTADRTVIEVSPTAHHSPEETTLALHLAMVEAHRACGLLCLHAAVLRRGDDVVAITGASGAGKSTAAYRLSQLGWSVVAEDTSWLTPSGDVVGWDEGLRLRPDSHALFAADERVEHTDAHGKRMLGVGRTAGGRLTRMIVLRPDADANLQGADQVRAWWEVSGLPVTPVSRAQSQQAILRQMGRVPVSVLDRNAVIERLGASRAHSPHPIVTSTS